MKKEMQNPCLSIDVRWRKIRIHRTTLKLLHHPEYIVILVNPELRTMAVISSEEITTAHRVNWSRLRKTYELTSKSLVQNLCGLCPEWKEGGTYRITGVYKGNGNVAEFNLEEAEIVRRS